VTLELRLNIRAGALEFSGTVRWHRRFGRACRSRYLPCCSDYYRVERTSSWRAYPSRCGPPFFHGAPDFGV